MTGTVRRLQLQRSLLRRGQWPKELRCLRCDQMRVSAGPGDRLHPKCREALEGVDATPPARVLV